MPEELKPIDRLKTVGGRLNILAKIQRIKLQLIDIYGMDEEKWIIHKLIMDNHSQLDKIDKIISNYEKSKDNLNKSVIEKKTELLKILETDPNLNH